MPGPIASKSDQYVREIAELSAKLSPEGRKVLENRFLPHFSQVRAPDAFDDLAAVDYRCAPISVREFVQDRDYLGAALGTSVYPKIIDRLEELFDGNFTEVILCGGIGWGKTTFAEIGVLYENYLLSCLREPAQTYGLIPGTTLVFPVVSVKKEQAERAFFAGIYNIAKRSPYFRETFPYEKNLKTEIRFPMNLQVRPVATTEGSLLGEGVFGAVFDEINFWAKVEHSRLNPEGGEYDEATVLYNRLSRRIMSRLNQRGRLPGHLWMISSVKHPDDFTEKKKVEALTNPRIMVCDYKAWDTRPASTYIQQSFKVEVGDKTRHSRVLEGSETDVILEKVIDVPIDFLDAFRKDPDGCVRDFAGISLLAIRPFMTRYDKIERMFQLGLEFGLKHPFTKLEVTLQDLSDKLIAENLHFQANPVLDERGRVRYDHFGRMLSIPKLHSGPYYGHCDLAKTIDKCGLGVVHIVGQKVVERTLGDYRLPDKRPVIRVDLLLRISRPPHGEIQAPLVRALWYELHRVGLNFGLITYDSWGSHETIQLLTAEGYNAENFSVDTSPEAYESLKSAIYDERLLCYPFPALQEELLTIIFDEKRQKVDHRPGGTKDIADALAGAVYHAERAFYGGVQVRPELPIQPGYRLGQTGPNADKEDIWDRIMRGESITEDEFDRL